MFKKFLAKLGKGAATVDLRFENRSYSAGETVHGEVLIQGGEVEQKINGLAARFIMNVVTKQGTVTREVATIPLTGAYTILPKEQKVMPFSYDIPKDVPLSRGNVSYYFNTHLDIEGGVDRTDFDRLVVEAAPEIQNIFAAFQRLGFEEKSSSGKIDAYGQEFSFFPRTLFVGDVEEIEVRFSYEEAGIRMWIEIDCRSRYGETEAKRELFIQQEELLHISHIAGMLKEVITEAVDHPHVYTQPFSYEMNHYAGHSHHRSPVAGMVGGLAVGILGGMLLDELVGDVMEEATEALGMDEGESFFGDFFGGDEEE